MFERYTEKARRVIFFARYEASQFGASTIESEHMLLGLLREDRPMIASFMLSPDAVTTIRDEVQALSPMLPKVSTAIDMALSFECKRALGYAAEEADRLQHGTIGTEHVMLGLLRVEGSTAAKILRKRGIDLESTREAVSKRKVTESPSQGWPRSMISAFAVLQVADLQRSAEWYREVLGFSIQLAGDGVLLRRDGVEIMLKQMGEAGTATGTIFIRVHDIEAFRSSIEQQFQTSSKPDEFAVIDLDGNRIIFIQES